jgi:hypothetical protein
MTRLSRSSSHRLIIQPDRWHLILAWLRLRIHTNHQAAQLPLFPNAKSPEWLKKLGDQDLIIENAIETVDHA